MSLMVLYVSVLFVIACIEIINSTAGDYNMLRLLGTTVLDIILW